VIREQLIRILGPLQGAKIPGGCEWCDAFQTVEPIKAGAWKITVHHDPGCTWFSASRRWRGRAA
jgi:hypothetical protein